MQGYKVYGAHLGPFKTPAREDDPPHLPPEFNVEQQAFLEAAKRGKAWTWSALRPSVVCGFALGIPMNLAMVIAAYATISKHLDVPLRFPGKAGAYHSLIEMTDARLLARAMVWAATDPRAANQAYNINNGDLFRWEEMWPRIAAYFEIPTAPRPADEPRHRDGRQATRLGRDRIFDDMRARRMRAVIMGGTSGIGLATAEQLTSTGIGVTVTGRDPARLAALEGRFAGAERVDSTDRDAVAAFFKRLGSFDHLVLAFSPGAAGLGPVREISLDDFETAFIGKLFAYIHAIREAQVTGSITMISAASARSAILGTVTLAAVNGAIERIVSPLAAELASVRVNAVSPGIVDTPWWSFLPQDQRQAQFAAAASGVPAGRIGTAADVAGAVAYLIDASLVTGIILPVDGGFTVA